MVMDCGVLGKSTNYAQQYDPSLLFPIARQDKRQELGIDCHHLPFHGDDFWNAYEVSWLNSKGKPQVALGQFRVPATTPFLVESKSLKLYLNSFNQTKFEQITDVTTRIATDLSAVAVGEVSVSLQSLMDLPKRVLGGLPGKLLDRLDIDCADYTQPMPELLRCVAGKGESSEVLCSHLLKSNCLVTGQPDWASIVIEYEGSQIEHESLLRYLVSFRQHNEFHEQCVERIFTDIQLRCQPARLSVWARYTRRGGLDINPWRTSEAGFGIPPAVAFDVRQ